MEKFLTTKSKPKKEQHLPVNITARERARQYQCGTFHASENLLFCSTCNVVVDHLRKYVVDRHLQSSHQVKAERKDHKETADITAVITKSPSPSYAVEGQNFTLQWTYTLDGSVGSAKFAIVSDAESEVVIWKSFRSGIINFMPEYQERFRAQATDTRAELRILAVQRSDEETYKLNILPTGYGSIFEEVILFVNFSSSITNITGTNVREGENVTLKCLAEGKPKPTITWTRLSDNSIVTMPLIHISRHDPKAYRCTADNGVGIPATGEVSIDVQYAPENVTLITNLTTSHKVCSGMVANFTCVVEASNPAVDTFTLFGNGSVVSNKRDSGVWIRTLTISGDSTNKCTANNSMGVSSSDYINFTVEVPASVTNISNSIVVREGQNVTLVCHGSGLPAPSITWSDAWNLVMKDENIWQLPKIHRNMAGQYICTASNACGNDSRKVDIDVQCESFTALKRILPAVIYPVEATGKGETAFVAGGIVKTFTCPVNGNPEPNIEWYSEETGRKIFCGKQYKTGESGCYSCVASNFFGTAVNTTQCLIVGHEIRAILTIITNFDQAFKDMDSASSKEFVGKFEKEMDKVYTNMPQYIRTKVTQLRPGSVIVYFILYFKTSVTPQKGIESLRVAISSDGTLGDFQVKDLVIHPEESTKSSTTTEIKCSCSDNETTLLVIIGVLGIFTIVLIAVIIWQQRKLRAIGNKRPYELPEERNAGFYESEIVMKNVNPAHLRPKNSTQQQIPDKLTYMPLKGISPTGEGSISPVSSAPNAEYAPLDTRTRSWEVKRNSVKVERIIGKGAFGQVAKGTAKNLPLRSGATNVAIKMVKANACESDKRDLKSELELMKTLKPHPHVIKLLGCVTESESLLVLIEYVPYGDLLGYLRKSRGLNDTYYDDPDIKPKTSLTSQQLMKFAWQIADGMNYLSLRKANISLRDGTSRIASKK